MATRVDVADEDEGTAPSRYSDDELAARFSARYADDLKYVPAWGWMLWDGKRFKRTPDVLVMQLARLVCRDAAAEARFDPSLTPSMQEKLRAI